MARGAAMLGVIGLGIFLSLQIRGDGVSVIWGLGLLAVAGGFLWETAGLLTKRESALPMRFLWPAMLLCIALGPIVFSTALHFVGGEAEAGARWRVGLLWAAPWILPLAASLWLPGWLRSQREACLRSGEGRTKT